MLPRSPLSLALSMILLVDLPRSFCGKVQLFSHLMHTIEPRVKDPEITCSIFLCLKMPYKVV